MQGIWGCELIEEETEDGGRIISEIGYTIDNTSKTRALFEINKGVNRHEGVEVNTKMPEELRRVLFKISSMWLMDQAIFLRFPS